MRAATGTTRTFVARDPAQAGERAGRRGLAAIPVGLAIGLAVVLGGPAPGRAQEELFVANTLGASVTVYGRVASGDAAPLRILAGPLTGLVGPRSVAVDPVHDELVVTNATTGTLTVHARAAGGNLAPLRTLAGPATGLLGPESALVDPIHDEIVVANGFGQAIRVYARTASGDAAPVRTLSGAATGLSGPFGVALDSVHGELAVTNITSGSVSVFSRTASGNAAPLRTLAGAATGLAGPRGVAVDPVHDEIFVANIASGAVTVYARTAGGNAAPLRTLAGPLTGLNLPVGVAVDPIKDELLVVGPGSVRVFPRTASGNVGPSRVLTGGATGLVAPTFAAVATGAPLAAAVLPSSRSVPVGTPATAFAAIINAGPGPASACAPVPITALPATFSFQTTDPATNMPTGTPDTPANIASGGLQTYVFAYTPSAAFGPGEAQLGFACAGTNRAPVTVGLNTLLLVASATPVPDVIAQSATAGNTGIVDIPGPTGTGAFAVATSNVGTTGTITVTADTGGAALPVTLLLCQTDAGGACLGPPAPSVTLAIPGGGTPTFGIFAAGSGVIPFDPATNRVFVRFREAGVSRGATSVAVRTR